MKNFIKRFLRQTAAPQRGFTLIEMVVVLGIIALLMLIIIPNLNVQRDRASSRQSAALTEIVHNQAETYVFDKQQPEQADTGAKPTKIEDVTLKDLREENYLNEKQYQQASREGIKPQRPAAPTNHA